MNTTAIPIVIDTNVVIAIIGKKSPFRWIFDNIIKGNFILCVSKDNHFNVLKSVNFPKVEVLTLPEFEQQFKNQ